jgi:hypothetical protein
MTTEQKVLLMVRHTKGRKHKISGLLLKIENGICHVQIGNEIVLHPIGKVEDENGFPLLPTEKEEK